MKDIAHFDIYIRKGITYNKTFLYYQDGALVDLTGYTAKMHIRKSPDDPKLILSLTTENSMIVLGDAAGSIKLTIPKAIADTLPNGVYGFDLALLNGSADEWFAEGTATIEKGFTE